VAFAWSRGWISRTSGRWLLAIALVSASLGIFGSRAVAAWNPIVPTSSFAPGLGLEAQGQDGYAAVGNDPNETTFTAPRYLVTVSANQEFEFSLTLRNDSALTIGILGLLPLDPAAANNAGYQIVDGERMPGPAETGTFSLAPGDVAEVVITGRAGTCSGISSGASQHADVLAGLRLAVDVGGLHTLAWVWPPFQIDTSGLPACADGADATLDTSSTISTGHVMLRDAD
jgi:hypothetical protein